MFSCMDIILYLTNTVVFSPISAVINSVTEHPCKYILSAFMIIFLGEVHRLVSSGSKGMEDSGAFLKPCHIGQVNMKRQDLGLWRKIGLGPNLHSAGWPLLRTDTLWASVASIRQREESKSVDFTGLSWSSAKITGFEPWAQFLGSSRPLGQMTSERAHIFNSVCHLHQLSHKSQTRAWLHSTIYAGETTCRGRNFKGTQSWS